MSSTITQGVPRAPGTYIQDLATPQRISPPVNSGRLHVVAITEKGPLGPLLVVGRRDARDAFGQAHFATADHALDAYFSLGGGEAVVSRVVGPGAARASATFVDDPNSSAPLDLLDVEAAGPGDYADGWRVEHSRSGDVSTFTVHDGDPSLDETVTLQVFRVETIDDLIDAAEGSRYVRFSRGADADDTTTLADIAAQTVELAGGDDDRANITDTEWADALARITDRWGPGQVIAPSRTSGTGHDQLTAHLGARERVERVAYLDTDRDDVKADLEGAATAVDDRRAGVFRPLRVSVGGRMRIVAGSAVAAALTATVDRRFPTAHVAPAGDRGLVDAAASLLSGDADFDTADRGDLNDVGVNLWSDRRGVMLYGFRATNGDPFHFGRHRMRLIADLHAQLSQYEFGPTDSDTLAEAHGDVLGILGAHADAGAILDDYSAEVTVSGSDTLVAEVDYQPVGFAERVVIAVPVPVSR